ncbi:MAG: nickel-dependent hydrogenase large subunit [Desulfobacteraceae bacterium]|nr:MAG: nickel-dependent hydrogenase large subunit [Desulfobacteraceae bacterium]
MSSRTISIDPVTRIEGHLAVSVEVEENKVVKAFCKGEMFRGFEAILKGRHPLDAQQITQRICGVCPVSHGIASILAQDKAYGISPPENGRILRNLIQGANYIQSHILHFYHLSALDYVDISAVAGYSGSDPGLKMLRDWVKSQLSSKTLHPGAPFLPRYEGRYIENPDLNLTALSHYLEALEMRALAHRMGALFAGKMPHVPTLVPGGVTEKVTAHKIASYKSMLDRLRSFIEHKYLPDVVEVATAFPSYFEIGKGCGNFLTYGAFPEKGDGSATFLPGGAVIEGKWSPMEEKHVTEDVRHSFYSSATGLPPRKGETVAAAGKDGAYSWLKAPRYNGKVVEVGPLARVFVSYLKGDNAELQKMVNELLSRLDRRPEQLVSVCGRHAARAVECKLVADRCAEWVEQLAPDQPCCQDFEIPEKGEGAGLTEAPRGALSHYIALRDHKIDNYQCVVPTTWNCSPRDDRGIAGAVEQALEGTPVRDPENPIETARVVRSFDPCIACAVH